MHFLTQSYHFRLRDVTIFEMTYHSPGVLTKSTYVMIHLGILCLRESFQLLRCVLEDRHFLIRPNSERSMILPSQCTSASTFQSVSLALARPAFLFRVSIDGTCTLWFGLYRLRVPATYNEILHSLKLLLLIVIIITY